jgi:hypothetical protein
MGQMSLITFFRRQVMSIAYYEAPSPAIFPSTNRRNWIVNLRTARALGFALSPDFISAANEVIE